jgi:hypothetical protein
MKIIVALAFFGILASLASALFYMMRGGVKNPSETRGGALKQRQHPKATWSKPWPFAWACRLSSLFVF